MCIHHIGIGVCACMLRSVVTHFVQVSLLHTFIVVFIIVYCFVLIIYQCWFNCTICIYSLAFQPHAVFATNHGYILCTPDNMVMNNFIPHGLGMRLSRKAKSWMHQVSWHGCTSIVSTTWMFRVLTSGGVKIKKKAIWATELGTLGELSRSVFQSSKLKAWVQG